MYVKPPPPTAVELAFSEELRFVPYVMEGSAPPVPHVMVGVAFVTFRVAGMKVVNV
jgi:hypothetical protein